MKPAEMLAPLVELVVLNDSPLYRRVDRQRVMQQMSIDPAVLGVVGPWMTEMGGTAGPHWNGDQALRPPVLIFPLTDHNAFSTASRARWAYDATKRLLDAIRTTYLESRLTRQSVEDRLRANG